MSITRYNYACYAHYTDILSVQLCGSVILYTLIVYCIMSNMCITWYNYACYAYYTGIE